MHPVLRLRPAEPADAPLLRRRDEAPHVLASDPNDDREWGSELVLTPPWREQRMTEVDGRPIGFVQIIDPALEESHYWAMSQRKCARSTPGSARSMRWAAAPG